MPAPVHWWNATSTTTSGSTQCGSGQLGRALERARVACERREQRLEPPAFRLVEARADPARVAQGPAGLVVVPDEQRSEPAVEPALARQPAADDELLARGGLHLAPGVAAPAGLVGAVEALGHDTLEPELGGGGEHRGAVARRHGWRLPRRAAERQRSSSARRSRVGQRTGGVAVEPQHVEEHATRPAGPLASFRAVVAEPDCMRGCSASKLGTPCSSSATISPSSTHLGLPRVTRRARASSGNRVRSRRCPDGW